LGGEVSENLYVVGCYADKLSEGLGDKLSIGAHVQFALQLHPREPVRIVQSRSELPMQAIQQLGHATVELSARVVCVRPDWWAIDAGIRFLCAGPPPKLVRPDSVVKMTGWVGVADTFGECLVRADPEAPPLFYHWSVERILYGRTWAERGETREAWRDVARLEDFLDTPEDQLHLLYCRLLD
jgi:hypothetical protein